MPTQSTKKNKKNKHLAKKNNQPDDNTLKFIATRLLTDVCIILFLFSGMFFLLSISLPETVLSVIKLQFFTTGAFLVSLILLGHIHQPSETSSVVHSDDQVSFIRKNAVHIFIIVAALLPLYFATQNFNPIPQALITLITLALYWLSTDS